MKYDFTLTAEEEKWIMDGIENLQSATDFFEVLAPEGPTKPIRDIQVVFNSLSLEEGSDIPTTKKQTLKNAIL